MLIVACTLLIIHVRKDTRNCSKLWLHYMDPGVPKKAIKLNHSSTQWQHSCIAIA